MSGNPVSAAMSHLDVSFLIFCQNDDLARTPSWDITSLVDLALFLTLSCLLLSLLLICSTADENRDGDGIPSIPFHRVTLLSRHFIQVLAKTEANQRIISGSRAIMVVHRDVWAELVIQYHVREIASLDFGVLLEG